MSWQSHKNELTIFHPTYGKSSVVVLLKSLAVQGLCFWVPWMLTGSHKEAGKAVMTGLLQKRGIEGKAFLSQINGYSLFGWQQWSLAGTVEHWEVWMLAFIELSLSPKKNAQSAAHPWQCKAITTQGHYNILKNSTVAPTLQSWPHAIRFVPVRVLKYSPPAQWL